MMTGVDIPRDFVFIHIPKAAGHTVGTVLHKPVRSHLTARLLKASYKEAVWETMFKFCFVRNPWDIVVSWYNFHHKTFRTPEYNCTFEEWIKDGLKTHWLTDWCGNEVTNDPLDQMLYFQDLEGKDVVDFIGAFETLEDDLAHVCHELSLSSITIPQLNACPHEHYRTYYTDETREIVRNRYANMIERFGYKF